MKAPLLRFPRPTLALAFGLAAVIAAVPGTLSAQSKKKNPASKVFVTDVAGEAQIDTGDSIEDVSKKSVFTAQGTIIETKPVPEGGDRSKAYSTMVYSNGTGAFFDPDTRVELKTFVQEPFTPNRSDVDVEPSISNTQAFLARGAVGLCASKLVSGSSMVYNTPHGSVNIRGQKVVIQAEGEETTISMLDGESTVKAGSMDMGGHTLKAGEQAIIRPGPPGQPNIIQIGRIPDRDAAALDEKVAMACMAKKTVYFDVRDVNAVGTGTTSSGGAVTAFDGAAEQVPLREIVPIEIVPNPTTIEPTTESSAARRPPETTI